MDEVAWPGNRECEASKDLPWVRLNTKSSGYCLNAGTLEPPGAARARLASTSIDLFHPHSLAEADWTQWLATIGEQLVFRSYQPCLGRKS